MSRRLCILGGAGFIGSHLADAAIANEDEVIIIDNLSTGCRQNLPKKAIFYPFDIRDEGLTELLCNIAPDVVSHHAAQKSVHHSIQSPVLDAQINIVGLISVLQACVQAKVGHFIFASSGGALCSSEAFSKEDDTPVLTSPYAVSKRAGEMYVELFSAQMTTTILRYANAYGERQTAMGDCGVIPIFMNNLLTNAPCRLHAWPDQPNGAIRDYIHVSDLVAAHNTVISKQPQGTFNLGTGVPTSTREVFDLLKAVTGSTQTLQEQGPRQGDLRRAVLNSEKARQVLQFEAKTPLRQGLESLLHPQGRSS